MKCIHWFVFSISVIAMIGCAQSRNYIVLMPDEDGGVGEISVTTEAGTQTVNQAYSAVTVTDANTAPTPPTSVNKEQIERIFGSAIKARSAASTRFVLYFVSGSTSLTDASKTKLSEIVDSFSRGRFYDIFIVGHSDTLGSEKLNMRLSLERANAVRDVLVALGIDPAKMRLTYHGEGDLLVPTGDNVREPRNRRVEVILQ